jgi:hypothetical protein
VDRSVADPDRGSGAFLTPGSGINIPDPQQWWVACGNVTKSSQITWDTEVVERERDRRETWLLESIETPGIIPAIISVKSKTILK